MFTLKCGICQTGGFDVLRCFTFFFRTSSLVNGLLEKQPSSCVQVEGEGGAEGEGEGDGLPRAGQRLAKV